MKHAVLAAVCVLCMLCMPSAARPDPSSRSMLLTILRGGTVAFTGRQRTVATLDDGGTAEAEVAVYSDGKGDTRREFLSGVAQGAVVLQRGRQTWQRSPWNFWSRVPTVPRDDSLEASLVAQNYRVGIFRGPSILGRSAVEVRLVPRRPFCPSRTVWLDPGSGVLLRDEVRGPRGGLRFSSRFISLALRPQPAPLFAPPPHAPITGPFGPAPYLARASAAAVERETGRRIGHPSHVPAGFRPVGYGVMVTPGGRTLPVIRYSDGLAAFTIFHQVLHPGFGRAPGWESTGATTGRRDTAVSGGVQGSIVVHEGQRSRYVLVGDIAPDELGHVAATLP